ncbi:ABC transporter ATP-binding protein [Gloeobacter violaceus]|uniref:HlyB/MsbA family ABC transporter n=1 Tax=Gloeobacter violaceus (strain ATCC 29082 / PCC 7421) TaxID=251221 RepID=Q7NH65_GLOVI|nr:ABC transporter ATP-binding protein [Gloeobacter violaceus]BAC90613.1 HlyB/MsbA family ABC transporter [Gloeobacter violaceus PCC 7421]
MASLRDVLGFYRPYWPLSAVTIGASSVLEVVDLAVPYATGQILNVLSRQPLDGPVQQWVEDLARWTGRSADGVLALAALMGIIFVVTVVRAPIQPWLGQWFHWDISLRARRDNFRQALEKLLRLPLEFYDENNPGRIAGMVARGVSNHTWTYPEVAGQLIPKLFRVLAIFVVIWLIEWRIAIAFGVSFALILGLTFWKLKRLVAIEERLERYEEDTESRTSEIITNIKTVKAFATERSELARQNRRFERELLVIDYRIHLGYVQLSTLRATLVQASMFGVLGFTLWETLAGRISLGHFVTTLTVSSMAYSEVSPIGELAEVFARRYASMIRFHEFMATPEGTDTVSLVPAATTVPVVQPFAGELTLENLSFGYDPNRPVLENIDLKILPRQTVALVGRSGSGKSTLVKLLFRYFEPTRGLIRIDGQDIRELDVAGYRRRLAIVHQEVDVFNGTLLENLLYGNPAATPDQVREACRIARVDEFALKLPRGYATVVGERGLRLSGGQRQRLGIARALIADPDVLIFDEATSSLDYESERAIQLAMGDVFGTRTTLVIAHRLSTIREADAIVVLDGGRIVQVGSHQDLLTQPGLYRRLHTLQETGELVG